MDPLSLVRQATLTNTPVEYRDSYYFFGNQKFHESTETCFRRTLKENQRFFYTLRDVIFYLERVDKGVAEYRRLALFAKLQAITVTDSENLKDYLTGKIDTCPQLDAAKAAESIAAAAAASKTAEREALEAKGSTSMSQIPQEQRQELQKRHAAILDQSIQRSTSTSVQATNISMTGVPDEKIEELRSKRLNQKRKDVHSDTTKFEQFDPVFIDYDKRVIAELRAKEHPSQNRSTVLCKINTNFSAILKPAKELLNSGLAKSSQSSHGNRAGSSSGQAQPQKRQKITTPIIIVPSIASCLTGLNVVSFLQDGVFISVENKEKEGAKRELEQFVTRKLQGSQPEKTIIYKIIDNPRSTMQEKDWDRVVAVFVAGKEWQFKDWKWSNPAELFQQVLGVHLTFQGKTVEPAVESWNCKVLKVSEVNRHLDVAARNNFWGYLDDFIKQKKPWLSPYQKK